VTYSLLRYLLPRGGGSSVAFVSCRLRAYLTTPFSGWVKRLRKELRDTIGKTPAVPQRPWSVGALRCLTMRSIPEEQIPTWKQTHRDPGDVPVYGRSNGNCSRTFSPVSPWSTIRLSIGASLTVLGRAYPWHGSPPQPLEPMNGNSSLDALSLSSVHSSIGFPRGEDGTVSHG
jgi:hypothetical protein